MWYLDVFDGSHRGQQIERLKDKPNVSQTKPRQGGVRCSGHDPGAVDLQIAFCRDVDGACKRKASFDELNFTEP